MVSTNNTIEKQKQSQPISHTSPLDAALQLAFILRTFNRMQVEAQWLQFMTTKLTGKIASSIEALGPNFLQDPPLAQQ